MEKRELEELVIYHQNKYYNSEPEIEDWEFDQLWDELATRFPESEVLKKVGNEGTLNGDKCKHIMHMGSQEKVTTYDAIDDWLRSKNIEFPVVVQEKCDGISVELVYVDKKFNRAVTRGDGVVGKLITDNAKLMKGVPSEINEGGVIAVRGEIMLPFDNVGKLVNVDTVTNVRNMASGIANQKNGTDNLDLLKVVCYDTSLNISETKKFAFLTNNKFITTTYCSVCNDLRSIQEAIELIKIHREHDRFGYQIDGAVIKQNVRPVTFDSSKARPDWQRAFKYPVEKVVTELVDIEWSRNGFNFTPVAILKPVNICDTVVSRASLANLKFLIDNDIDIGDEVLISKRNDIIPHVEKVYKKRN